MMNLANQLKDEYSSCRFIECMYTVNYSLSDDIEIYENDISTRSSILSDVEAFCFFLNAKLTKNQYGIIQ